MKKGFFALYLLLYAIHAIAQPAFITDSLDLYIEREMQRWNIPGLAIAIVKDGSVVVSKGYGVRSMDSKAAVDENTLFQIASNSKSFTGTSLAMLEEQNRLRLNEKVTKYLKAFKLSDPNITRMLTIEDLVSHRMGYETFQGDFLHWNSNLTREEIISNMQNLEPVYDFRDTYGYCNVGYVAAGEIIRVVTDTVWDDFVKQNLFIPLMMNRTSTHVADIMKDKNAATAHTIVENELIKIPYANIDNLGPAASINSSVNDMSNWLLMHLAKGKFNNTTVVPYAALKNTYSSRTIERDVYSSVYPDAHFRNYGLGWSIGDYKGRRVMWHGGGANGFVTTSSIIPEENLGIVILTNTDANSLYDALRYQIMEAYFNMPYRNLSALYYSFTKPANDAEWKEINEYKAIVANKNLAEYPLEQYAGNYKNKVYGEIQIKFNGDILEVFFPHHPFMTATLEPMGGNEFLCTYSDPIYGVKKVSFSTDQGRIEKITLTVNDFVDLQPYDFFRL